MTFRLSFSHPEICHAPRLAATPNHRVPLPVRQNRQSSPPNSNPAPTLPPCRGARPAAAAPDWQRGAAKCRRRPPRPASCGRGEPPAAARTQARRQAGGSAGAPGAGAAMASGAARHVPHTPRRPGKGCPLARPPSGTPPPGPPGRGAGPWKLLH